MSYQHLQIIALCPYLFAKILFDINFELVTVCFKIDRVLNIFVPFRNGFHTGSRPRGSLATPTAPRRSSPGTTPTFPHTSPHPHRRPARPQPNTRQPRRSSLPRTHTWPPQTLTMSTHYTHSRRHRYSRYCKPFQVLLSKASRTILRISLGPTGFSS